MIASVSGNLEPASAGDVAAGPLRVLFYCCFPGGGIGRYTHELLSHLSNESDLEVELACLPSYHWRDAARYPIWSGLREISHPSPLRRRTRFFLSQFANPRRLFHRAAECRAQIIHFSNINHLTFAYWKRMADRGAMRLVATAHDVERAKPMLHRGYESGQLRAFYRRADALFVHSRAQVERLREYAGIPGERIHLVPHGPYDYGRASASQEELRLKFGLPRDRQVALFFGNVRDEKNLELMIRSLAGFRDTLHLLVAGRGDGGPHKPIAWYKSLAEQLSLHAAVTFVDRYIPDEQVPDLFEACDWVALPYGSSFTSQSGVLNVAVSCRRPVLATSAPTLGETLTASDIGVLIQPDSLDALTEGIRRIREQTARRRPFAFDDYLARYSWNENVRLTTAVYRSLVSNPSEQKGRTPCDI